MVQIEALFASTLSRIENINCLRDHPFAVDTRIKRLELTCGIWVNVKWVIETKFRRRIYWPFAAQLRCSKEFGYIVKVTHLYKRSSQS